ncbi:MAG: nuclear transport factor 2 family protein [Gammaproteobacteria bacterium]|jgi:uncharacterized protein (TIGR02246 family)|nr:nuclear transport factor 2 family protein [Gammaproteobacteria bacterium]
MTTLVSSAMVDTVAIHELLARLTRAVDEGTVEQVAGSFREDAEWDLGVMTWQGKSAIAAGVESMRKAGFSGPGTNTRHIVSNVVVDFRSDMEAEVAATFVLMAKSPDGVSIRAMGDYRDVLVRDGRWLVAKRTSIV